MDVIVNIPDMNYAVSLGFLCFFISMPITAWIVCLYGIQRARIKAVEYMEWLDHQPINAFLAAAHEVCDAFASAADYGPDQRIEFDKRLHKAIFDLYEAKPEEPKK